MRKLLILFIFLFSYNVLALDKIRLKSRNLDTMEFIKKSDLEVKLKKKVLKNAPKSSKKYIDAVFYLSKHYDIDPVYLMSLIWVESHFKCEAKSYAGAKGLMQIMPKTEAYLLEMIDNQQYLSLIRQIRFINANLSILEASNLVLGTFYIDYLRKRFKNANYFTAAYNMGPTWVSKKLKTKYPVGSKNHYVNKIKSKYNLIARN